MTDRLLDLLIGVAETVAWCLLVGIVAGALGWGIAEWRFERKRKGDGR